MMSDRLNCHACERESTYANHGWICTKRAGCVEMVIHAAAIVYPTIDYTALEAELATLRALLDEALDVARDWSCSCRTDCCTERGRLQPVVEARSECPRLRARTVLAKLPSRKV